MLALKNKNAALGRLVFWTLLTIVVDQVSKAALVVLRPSWVTLNRGVAFSVPAPIWVVVLSALVLVVLATVEWRNWQPATRLVRAWAVGLLLGGALSNLLDRALFGGVRDFIDVRVWPVFNLADTALTIGVLALLWYAVRSSHTFHASRQGAPPTRARGHN